MRTNKQDKQGKAMTMTKKNFTLGTDPEVFVEDDNGKLLPAFDFLPSKYEPREVAPGQTAYWDGFQAEFSVVPSTSISKVLASVRLGLAGVLKAAQEKNPKARLSPQTVVDVDLDYLRTINPEYSQFGCMPSYNVYQISGMGIDGIDCPHRFSGGHIHAGIGKQTEDMFEKIVRNLDALVAVAGVSMFENIDNPIRRRYYGLAGEFRMPPHGIEYRPLSNAWLFNPECAHMMFDVSRKVMQATLAGELEVNNPIEDVIETVLLSNVDKARGMIEGNADLYKKIDFKPRFDLTKPIETSLNMKDVAKNWKIG